MQNINARKAVQLIVEEGGIPLNGHVSPPEGSLFVEFSARTAGVDEPQTIARLFNRVACLREHLERCHRADAIRGQVHGCECAGVLGAFAISGRTAGMLDESVGTPPFTVSEFREHFPEFEIVLPNDPPRRQPAGSTIHLRITPKVVMPVIA